VAEVYTRPPLLSFARSLQTVSKAFAPASVLQNPSSARGVVQAVRHRLKAGKDSNDRKASGDRREVGRAPAARSGSSVSCGRKAGSFRIVGSHPEASWEFVLSWLISPRILEGTGVSRGLYTRVPSGLERKPLQLRMFFAGREESK